MTAEDQTRSRSIEAERRAARLTAALRDNLKKRKAQMRERADDVRDAVPQQKAAEDGEGG